MEYQDLYEALQYNSRKKISDLDINSEEESCSEPNNASDTP